MNKRASWLHCFQDKTGRHRWRIQSSNGKVIAASSQGFTTLASLHGNLLLVGKLLNDSTMQAVSISAMNGKPIPLYAS